MTLSLSYTVRNHGWANCALEIDGAKVFMEASYLSDAFNDLIGATLSIVANGAEGTVDFYDEPGTYRWKLCPSSERLYLKILAYDELFARESDPSGHVIFNAECRLRTFAGAVLSAAQQLLRTHGEAGYQKIWGHEFPLKRMEELKRALDEATHQT